MALQIITALVSSFEAAISAAEDAYWAEQEREAEDYRAYYESAGSPF
jgi:hypothetical protein